MSEAFPMSSPLAGNADVFIAIIKNIYVWAIATNFPDPFTATCGVYFGVR